MGKRVVSCKRKDRNNSNTVEHWHFSVPARQPLSLRRSIRLRYACAAQDSLLLRYRLRYSHCGPCSGCSVQWQNLHTRLELPLLSADSARRRAHTMQMKGRAALTDATSLRVLQHSSEDKNEAILPARNAASTCADHFIPHTVWSSAVSESAGSAVVCSCALSCQLVRTDQPLCLAEWRPRGRQRGAPQAVLQR
jgi:hypothetical protein